MSEEQPYNLKESADGVGKLVPILKDAQGNVIDGFHRQKIDPNWPSVKCETVDNPTKLALARLASNFCRRQVKGEELQKSIVYLIGKAGLKPEEIAKKTGISERTIYRHLPQEFKQPKAEKISEAKSEVARHDVTAVTSHRKIPDMVECDACGTGTRNPRPFGRYNQLCERCYGKAIQWPRIFARTPPTKPKPKEYKPKESWAHRKAQMQPMVSKMDTAVLEELHRRGHKVEFQKSVCLERTIVDFIVDGKPVYLDGRRVHQNREWTDDKIRGKLATIMQRDVQAITYERYKKSGAKELVDSIEEALQ